MDASHPLMPEVARVEVRNPRTLTGRIPTGLGVVGGRATASKCHGSWKSELFTGKQEGPR